MFLIHGSVHNFLTAWNKKNAYLFCRNWSRGYFFVWFVWTSDLNVKEFQSKMLHLNGTPALHNGYHSRGASCPEFLCYWRQESPGSRFVVLKPVLKSAFIPLLSDLTMHLGFSKLQWLVCLQKWCVWASGTQDCKERHMSPFTATIRNSNSPTLPLYPQSLRLLLHGQSSPLLTPSQAKTNQDNILLKQYVVETIQ